MKLYARIAVAVLCAALILGIPFFLSSPKLLSDAESDIFSEDYEEDSLDGSFSLPRWRKTGKAISRLKKSMWMNRRV